MHKISCSIYYPHYKLHTLAKYGLMTIFNKICNGSGTCAFNYFLSTYKGENTVLQIYLQGKDKINPAKKMIVSTTNDFFKKYKSEYMDESLPLNHIFLNIPPNNVQYWHREPFKERKILDSNEYNELGIRSKSSHLCVIQLAKLHNLGQKEIFSFYIKQLLIFHYVMNKLGTGHFTSFLKNIMIRIKEIQHDWLPQIRHLEREAKRNYADDESCYSNIFKMFLYGIDSNNNKSDDNLITDMWISVIHDAIRAKLSRSTASLEEFLAEFFIIITQKISLQAEILITSIGIVNEFFKRNDISDVI